MIIAFRSTIFGVYRTILLKELEMEKTEPEFSIIITTTNIHS